MQVRIIRTVPGYVNGRTAAIGETLDLPTGLALSLVTDGYAAAVATAPVEARETATAPKAERRTRRAAE